MDAAMTLAEDERNIMPKNNITKVRQVTINAAHTATHKNKTTIRHRRKNMGNAFSTATRRRINSMTRDSKHLQFRSNSTIATYHHDDKATLLTYNSGAYVHYLRK